MDETHPLRAWRKAHEITLAQLAGAVGVTASHLSEIETGKNAPSLDLAGRLSRATASMGQQGVPIDAFLQVRAA